MKEYRVAEGGAETDRPGLNAPPGFGQGPCRFFGTLPAPRDRVEGNSSRSRSKGLRAREGRIWGMEGRAADENACETEGGLAL
jgi:hypothetical protein